MKCDSCGKMNPNDSRFCNNCGSKLNDTQHDDVAIVDNKDTNVEKHNLEREFNKKRQFGILKMGVIIIVIALTLIGGIKVFNYASDMQWNSLYKTEQEPFTREELQAQIYQYAENLANGHSNDDTREQLYNSDKAEILDIIKSKINFNISVNNYGKIYSLANVYIDVFGEDSSKDMSLVMEYSIGFADYDQYMNELSKKYVDIEAVYNNRGMYLNRNFYISQVIEYDNNLVGTINEISDAISNKNVIHYVAYDVIHQVFGEFQDDIPYLITTSTQFNEAGSYIINVLEEGTKTLTLKNGFTKEVTAYKEVAYNYYDNLETDYSEYLSQKNIVQKNIDNILKIVQSDTYKNGISNNVEIEQKDDTSITENKQVQKSNSSEEQQDVLETLNMIRDYIDDNNLSLVQVKAETYLEKYAENQYTDLIDQIKTYSELIIEDDELQVELYDKYEGTLEDWYNYLAGEPYTTFFINKYIGIYNDTFTYLAEIRGEYNGRSGDEYTNYFITIGSNEGGFNELDFISAYYYDNGEDEIKYDVYDSGARAIPGVPFIYTYSDEEVTLLREDYRLYTEANERILQYQKELQYLIESSTIKIKDGVYRGL